MFGKKKSKENADAVPDEKPSVKAPKAKSTRAFDPKEFLLLHAEKFVFALIALASLGLVYLGATTKSFDSKREPTKLSSDAGQVLTQIRENHWDAIKNEEARVKGIIDVSYTEKSIESTKSVPTDLYHPEIPRPGSRVTGYRSDPSVLAPMDLVGGYYFGPIVVGNANASLVEFLDKLPDAKVKEEKKEKEKDNKGGRGGPPPGYGQDGGSGGPPGGGMSGLGGPAPAKDAKRFLANGYDQGFPSQTLGPSVDKDGKKKIIGPRDLGFVSVVALAPHQEMEKEYRAKLSPGGGIMPGRDTPNYVGFEVERADVTDDPSRELQDADWKPLPNAGSEKISQLAKTVWLGSNQEVLAAEWTTPTLTMPVPPVLLKSYAALVSHKEIPSNGRSSVTSVPIGGMGGGSGDSGNDSDGLLGGANFGSGAGGAPPGYPGGGSTGAPPGYPGGSGSAPPGIPGGGSGSAPPGYPGGGSGSAPPGFGGGSGSAPPGYPGGGSGSAPPGFGGGGMQVAPPEAPKELPSTKYKAVRFYDFEAKPNRIYRYRVRLLMYDPNFPEFAGIQPRSSMMDIASGALKRVQDLLEKERKDQEASKAASEAKGKDTNAGPIAYRRNSSRKTDWSAPSAPIATKRVAESFLGEVSLTYSSDRDKKFFESNPPKAEMVLADYDSKLSVVIPRKDSASRGYVFGLPNRDAGKEIALETIHPISKVIKALEKRDVKSLCSVIDIHGMAPLEMKVAKDAYLKTGGDAVAFDPESGRIVVMREFDDFTGYGMHTQPDKTAVGPLGGPLKVESVSSMGGMGAGAGAGGPGIPGTGGGSGKPAAGAGGGGGGGNTGSSSAE
jgi:hypothetical protein